MLTGKLHRYCECYTVSDEIRYEQYTWLNQIVSICANWTTTRILSGGRCCEQPERPHALGDFAAD